MTQHSHLKNMAKLGVALGLAVTSYAWSAPVELMLNGPNVAPSDPAYVRNSDNTKQWVSSSCRADLVSAGLPVTTTDWSEIGGYADTNDWMSCSQLVSQISSGGGSSSTGGGSSSSGGSGGGSVSLLINGAANDGWVVYADGTRQWVSGSCRTQLQSAGISDTVTNWATISAYPTGAWQSCSAIEALIDGSGGGSS